MSSLLSEPGFYEIDADDYHHDPAPEASLSNSVGRILLEQCPRAAWWAHPRLNPQFTENHDTKFDRGTVAHTILLGKGNAFRLIDAPDYKSKAAQMQRDAYREAGFTPVLVGHHATAEAMAIEARRQLKDIDGGEFAFNSEFGDIELCGLAKDPVGCWARTLIDFYGASVPDGVTCWDYKTTSGTANPLMVGSKMDDLWAFQAAFQERVITVLKPALAGRIRFRFLVQENEEPYLCSVVEPTSAARTIAHKQVAAAMAIWHACMQRGAWPGYSRNSVAIGGAPWKEAAWLSRELGDELVQLAAHDPFLTTAFQMGVDQAASGSERTVLAKFEDGKITEVKIRKPRGPYKPRKPKAPPELPPGTTMMDAG
jgi:hypothetical protein